MASGTAHGTSSTSHRCTAKLCPSLPPASVRADNHPDQLWGRLAVCIPSWLVIFPDWIHDFSDCSLHKFLRSDLQQERGVPKERVPEGPPEWVHGCRERTRWQLFLPGKQCETTQAAEGLKSKSRRPPSHVA